ncbi:MAG: molybdopterin-dependent oxidoreductase [Hyphomicrobiales bacterium]|nr:molybdopterin-dependent oxidoreductase [Hyphomicrobiales bacterium]
MSKSIATSAPGEVKVVPSTCSECSVHCGSLIYVRNGVIEDIKPYPAHPLSKGAFCIKGLKGPTGLAFHENRLLYPLRRTGEPGEGKWRRISWNEALDHAAERFSAVREKYGPLSLVGACNNANVSRGVPVVMLLRSLGSPNWMINQDLCGGCRAVSSRATGLDITRGEDIEHARCALVVGRNSYEADPIEWIALKELKKRGGRIVVIDPKRTPTVKIADLWLRPHTGTDAALGLAMIHVMIAEGLYDENFVKRYTYGFDKLRERAAEFLPERAEALTGVLAKNIIEAARIYADGPSTFVSGHGIDAFSNGVQTFRAFHCLVAISGNVDRLGGNRRVKKPKGFLDNLQVIHDPKFRLPKEIEDKTLGADKYPLWAGPRGWQTACHNPTVIDAILTGKPYPVRAMYVSGANIVVTYPNTSKTVEALRSLDFLMVASDTMTPTAELADIVLPKTTALEEDDIRLQPGGPLITMTQIAIPPRGEARNDLSIARGLYGAMEKHGAVTRNFLPWQNEDEFIEYMLGDSGVTLEQLRRDGFATYPYELEDFGRFATPTGKVELYSEAIASTGVDPLPRFVAPARDSADDAMKAGFPLTLTTGDREKTYHHSRFRDQPWAKKISPDPRLLINPETAKAYSIADDQWVRLETPGVKGSCRLKVKITDATPEGVVSTGMGWWRPGSMAPGRGAFDVNINAAVTYDGPWDPISGSADTRGIRCRITAVDPGASA